MTRPPVFLSLSLCFSRELLFRNFLLLISGFLTRGIPLGLLPSSRLSLPDKGRLFIEILPPSKRGKVPVLHPSPPTLRWISFFINRALVCALARCVSSRTLLSSFSCFASRLPRLSPFPYVRRSSWLPLSWASFVSFIAGIPLISIGSGIGSLETFPRFDRSRDSRAGRQPTPAAGNRQCICYAARL